MTWGKRLAVLTLVTAGVAGVLLPGAMNPTASPAVAAPPPKDDEGKKQALAAAWADLASADDLTASRALLVLRDHAAVGFFADKLKPLTLTEERAKGLLADLGSDDDKTWRAAYDELHYLDPRLVMSVPDMVKDSKGLAHDERLAALLHDSPPDKAEVFKWCKITMKINPAPPKPGTPVPAQLVLTNHPDKPAKFKTWLDEVGLPTGLSLPIAADVAGLKAGYGLKASWRRAVRATAVLEHLGGEPAKKLLEKLSTGHPDAAPTLAARAAVERWGK